MASTLAFRTTGTTTTGSTTIPKRPKVATAGLSGVDGVHVQVCSFPPVKPFSHFCVDGNIRVAQLYRV